MENILLINYTIIKYFSKIIMKNLYQMDPEAYRSLSFALITFK